MGVQMTVQADKAHHDHVEALIHEQAFASARMNGISVEEAERLIRTAHGTGEEAAVHPTYAASVAQRADERQTTR